MPKQRPLWPAALVLLLGLCVALKLLVLTIPRYDLFGFGTPENPQILSGEEASRGCIAVEVMDGPVLHLLDYQWASFFGGSLVVGLAAIPFFAVLGPSMAALKLVPIAFHAVSVLFLFLALARVASRRAAWIGSALLALAPPSYAVLTTVAWGTHGELNAIVALALYLFARAWTTEPPGRPTIFLLGLACGFGLYFGYGFLLVIATLAVLAFLRDKLFFWGQRAVIWLLGFAIGFSPWIIYNLRHDFRGLIVYQTPITSRFPLSNLALLPERMERFVRELFPRSFCFRDFGPLPGPWISTTAAIACALFFLLALVRLSPSIWAAVRGLASRRSPGAVHPGLVFIVYTLIYVPAFLIGRFYPDPDSPMTGVLAYRYVFVVYPCLFAAVAIGADWVCNGPAWIRVPSRLALIFLLGSGLAGTVQLCGTGQAGRLWKEQAFWRPGHGRWMVEAYPDEIQVFERFVARSEDLRSPEASRELYLGMAHMLRILSEAKKKNLPMTQRHLLDDYLRLREFLYENAPSPYCTYFGDGEIPPLPSHPSGGASDSQG